jgi:predicted nucleotidyltransferase
VAGLDDRARAALDSYLELLARHFGERLRRVELFGSAAREDMWSEHQPFRSDIDILVVVDSEVGEAESEALTDATYPLFLDCGKQISPNFVSESRIEAPPTEKDREVFARIAADRRVIWPGDATA